MQRHYTATVYIFFQNKVLLHYHPKMQTWLPPGGHVENNETPAEAALREVKEETGLDIALIEQENLLIHCPTSSSIPRPFLCLLENIDSFQGQPPHQHIDFIYLAKPTHTPNDVIESFRWFTYEELPHDHLLDDVKEVLHLLLKEKKLDRLLQEEAIP